MLVWNGTALGSILLNEIYDLADIHFLQFIAYISASLSIRFQPFFSCDGAGIHTSRLLQSGLTSNLTTIPVVQVVGVKTKFNLLKLKTRSLCHENLLVQNFNDKIFFFSL